MIDFHLIFSTSLFIFGLNYLLAPNKTPLSWLGEFLDLHLPLWIQKPLYVCSICMASIYMTLAYWINTNEINTNTILLWLVNLVVTVGLNRVIFSFLTV